MTEPATDWKSLIADLQGKGMTLAEIGAEVGRTPSALSDITHGRAKSPRHEVALKLLDLHKSRCSETQPSS